MSLLGGVGNFFKKAVKGIAKVALPAVGNALGGPVGGMIGGSLASGIGSDGMRSGKKMARAQIGGMANFLPTGFVEDPRMGGGGATGYWDMAPIGATPGTGLQSGTGAMCGPKVLRSGKVRYPRFRADGTCYFPRRMNPLNPRAARRAIRRIKAVRRITRDIERSLPKVSTRRRAA